MAAGGLRVDPPAVLFHDVTVGQVYQTKIRVLNVGKTSKKIVFKDPALKLFRFSGSSSVELLCPGLSVFGMLHFTPKEDKEVTDSLQILVEDEEPIEIPLQAFPKACSLETESVVDFGCIAADGQVITKNHCITNQGSAPGVFSVDYQGDPSVSVSPSAGVIAAGATQWLKLELRADRPRLVEEKALVKLQNRSDITVSIRAEVCDLSLEIFDLQGNQLPHLHFKPQYFGTTFVRSVVLRNKTPLVCDWVCQLKNPEEETEAGTHLQESSDAALLESKEKCSSAHKDVSNLMLYFPRQGTVGPYQNTTVEVRFTPIRKRTSTGWKHNHPIEQQDYNFVLQFESVGSRCGFTGRNGGSIVELAVTGTGLPVSLKPCPSRLDFKSCVIGQPVNLTCVLQNHSPRLPVKFCLRKLAHVTAHPSFGNIPPRQSRDVVFTFIAQRHGSFQMNQLIELLGLVVQTSAETTNRLELKVFHTIGLPVSAVCCSETAKPAPKLKPGITPTVTNPTGLQPRVQSPNAAHCHQTVGAANLNANKTKRHVHDRKTSQDAKGKEPRTLPNDRAASIRPASPNTQDRQQNEKDEDVDMGIVPAQGLVPPKLRVINLETSSPSGARPKSRNASPAIRQMSGDQDAVPANSQQVEDYHRTLTSLELLQIGINPLFVDFGEVCVQSVCVKKLDLINNLPVSVWVQFDIDCPELKGSSPLSHALAPQSRSTLLLTFQSNQLGEFYNCVPISINHQHPGQVVIQAHVVPLALELSTPQVVVQPSDLAHSGYRSYVTLRNRRNHPAKFTWRPVGTDCDMAFSIQPVTGTVEPKTELDCEVVWHSSFSASAEGNFDLCVEEGNTQQLRCVAKMGSTEVVIGWTLNFWSVPMNVLSVRTVVLRNTGHNHAYYKVLETCPLQGMALNPLEGVVPVGGSTELEIRFNPNSVMAFNNIVTIALRNLKPFKFRLMGSVEPPNIDISVSNFNFSGVHVGSRRTIPFSLSNLSSVPAQLTFDLSEHTDFSVQLPQPSAGQCHTVIDRDPGVTVADLQANQTLQCSLVFCPTQMTSHNFVLPLRVNGLRWPTGSLSPAVLPSSSLLARSRPKVAEPLPVSMVTHRIQATGLYAPLELSHTHLQFHVTSGSDIYFIKTAKTVHLKALRDGNMFWRAGWKENITWWFDNDDEEALCSVSPSSGSLGAGQSICLQVSVRPEAIRSGSGRVRTLLLPLYLGDERDEGMEGGCVRHPYRELSITVMVELPRISSHPRQIYLTPLPLGSRQTVTLTLFASGYPSGTSVSAEVDDVLLENGTKIQPVSIRFPEGNKVPAQKQDLNREVSTTLVCQVSFCSDVPLSICTTITFSDFIRKRLKVKLYATTENCLLTSWPYMVQYKQKVVFKPAVKSTPQLCPTPSPTSVSTTSSSTVFDSSSSTGKNSSSGSCPDSSRGSSQATMHTNVSPSGGTTHNPNPEFPATSSDQGTYSRCVLLAMERWFSFFGWPGGPHPISIPHSLRRVTSKVKIQQSNKRTCQVSQNKDCRTVWDMIYHLAGIQIYSFPRFMTLSADVDKRTEQLLQWLKAMLTFLRLQGVFLSHVEPGYLLDVEEFKHWCSLESGKEDSGLDCSKVDYESLSKQAWADVLMQIYKVLVLRRVSESLVSGTQNPKDVSPFNSRPLSNIYSAKELQLLSWLTFHYRRMRTTVWGLHTGGVQPAPFVVNFDQDLRDGLVLAAVLAAYCPYLIPTHFQRMYATTSCSEQILHNNIIVTQALNTLHLNMDIQPADMSDPNPVQMLMLCVHLYERLPDYLAKQTVILSGNLHTSVVVQVNLRNPASIPIKYHAFLLGKKAHLFSLPDGSVVTLPPISTTALRVQYNSLFLQPKDAVLLFVAPSSLGRLSASLVFNLKSHVSHITPTKTVICKSPCYEPLVVTLPVTNRFSREGKFKVMLMELTANPFEKELDKESLICQVFSKTSSETTEETLSEMCVDNCDFLSIVKSICLKPDKTDTLNIHWLPFSPGTKYCLVLLMCPEVGDMVYVIQAIAGLPCPSFLTTIAGPNIPGTNITSVPSVPTLTCKVGQRCDKVLRIPLINVVWERALATWGQFHMRADEYRRRQMSSSLNSSTVRARIAELKLKAARPPDFDHNAGVEYNVEVSLPQNFTLPSTVAIKVKENTVIPWEDTEGGDFIDIPFRFQADSVGRYTCQVVLRSWHDTRVYILETLVTPQRPPVHMNFRSPARRSVTQEIPVDNETQVDWNVSAELCGEGFSGPAVLKVPAGTKVHYPLTFHPSVLCNITGTLSLRNDWDGDIRVFTLKGVGERPPPVDHVIVRCSVGQSPVMKLDVPNVTQRKLKMMVATDLSIVNGSSSLDLSPGCSTPYTFTVSTLKRGNHTGYVSFIEIDGEPKETKPGNSIGLYEAYYSVDVICEPEAPVKVVEAQCVIQCSVTITIPLSNAKDELLMFDVTLEGDNLTGESSVSVPPGETLNYVATFSPARVGKKRGSVLFQSKVMKEFWYQLDLYSLPFPVMSLPIIHCPLGRWTKIAFPIVNPTAEPMKLFITNNNPRNFMMEKTPVTMQPHSCTPFAVCFRPSSIGKGKHKATITIICPEMQEWCVFLSGCGISPGIEEPLRISSLIGSTASITIPIKNPTECLATLSITLTDEDPSAVPESQRASPEKKKKRTSVFSIPLTHTEGIRLTEEDHIDVPVVFSPVSVDPQQAWLCFTLTPIDHQGGHSSADKEDEDRRWEQDDQTVRWVYPLHGIPL